VAADYLKISKPAYDTPSQQETNADSSLYEKAPEELFVKSQEKDVEKRTKLNKTTFNKLLRLGVLDSLNDEENNSLL
jgi:DNA polymerase III alpha subunit (gram-positive type)